MYVASMFVVDGGGGDTQSGHKCQGEYIAHSLYLHFSPLCLIAWLFVLFLCDVNLCIGPFHCFLLSTKDILEDSVHNELVLSCRIMLSCG